MVWRLAGIMLLCIFSQGPAADTDSSVEAFKRAYDRYQSLWEAESWRESLEPARQSYAIGRELFGDQSENTAALAYNYSLNLLKLGREGEAAATLKETLALYEQVYGDNSPQLIPVLMDLGRVHTQPLKAREALKYHRRALALASDRYGADTVDYARRSVQVGVALLNGARSPWAKDYLLDGYEILARELGETSVRAGFAALHLGKFELSDGDDDQAIAWLQKALTSFTDPDAPSNKLELLTHGFMVKAYENQGRRDLATRHCLAIGRMSPALPSQRQEPLVRTVPVYPIDASDRRQEGYVVLEFEVDEEGFVRNPQVVEREGPRSFVAASLDAIEQFRYAPGFSNGKPVATEGVLNRFTFEMAE